MDGLLDIEKARTYNLYPYAQPSCCSQRFVAAEPDDASSLPRQRAVTDSLHPKERRNVELDYLGILLRWLHILPAIAMVGGTLYMRLAVVPATEHLPEEQRSRVKEILRSRWAKVVSVSILLLLFSGIVNLVRIVGNTPPANPGLYHPLFAVKFLLAMTIFFISSVLMGTSSLAEKFRQKATWWLSINLTLAVVLVCIAGVLHGIEKLPKQADEHSRLNFDGRRPPVVSHLTGRAPLDRRSRESVSGKRSVARCVPNCRARRG